MTEIRDFWLEKTHVDPNYFLLDILKFLGIVPNEEDFGDSRNSTTYLMDENAKIIGTIAKTSEYILIRRKVSN